MMHFSGSHRKQIQAGGTGGLHACFRLPLPQVDANHFCSSLNGQSKANHVTQPVFKGLDNVNLRGTRSLVSKAICYRRGGIHHGLDS